MIDVCKTDARISRFGNYLCQTCLGGSSEPEVIELAAKALARLTQVSGTYTTNLKTQLVNHEVKRAFEYLQSMQSTVLGQPLSEREEAKRFQRGYAAVLVLREIACCMPTFFFQNVSQFYDVIFNAVWDSRLDLRESAVHALRAGLIVTVQRESAKQAKHQHQVWYKTCYTAVTDGLPKLDASLNDSQYTNRSPAARALSIQRDDRIHGSLLVLAELLRCSNGVWERANSHIEENIIQRDQFALQSNNVGSSLAVSPTNNVVSYPDKLKGGLNAVKRYYQSGFNRQSRSSTDPTYIGASRTVVSSIPFNWFGSTLPGREQIVESALLKALLYEHYDEICKIVLQIATNPTMSRNANIQNALLLVLPKLASFQQDTFVEKYLQQSMSYMDKLLLARDRYNAYIGIGLLAVAAGPQIESYLKNVLENIRQNLPSKQTTNKKRQNSHLDPAIFACISMLASAVKHHIRPEISQMLDSMLSVGLSPALTTALYELAQNIPAFKNEIADGLLKILSLILMQQQYRHPGTPKHLVMVQTPMAHGGQSPEPPDTASIVLGLRTLGSFDFEGHSLLQFVRHCADNYLHSEEKLIRLEAVRTCSSLLEGTLLGLAGRNSQTVMSTVNEVLAKLLVVGITDRDPDIRLCVMDCLNECFDNHLAQPENLTALFVALNDEQFEIRELTMCIIGRLSILNPAHIMPSLRKTLIQLLTEIEHSGVGRNKEQSARILGHLVANAPTLIRPYVNPILSVLIPKLKETDLNPMVITSLLRAIGDLAQVGGKLMTQYVNELLPILLDILNDASSSQKREVSLWTLAQLVESTGAVITPYHRYPNLLDTLLGFLRTEQRQSIRSQTLRLLGLLGALDPYKHKLNTGQIDSASVKMAPLIPVSDSTSELELSYEMSPSEMLVNMGSGTLDDFYPSVAIATLMKIIRDPTLFRHHTEVVKAVTFIFKALGIKSVPYISQVIPSMMNVIRSSDNAFRDFLFQQLGGLISIVQQHIRNYLDDIFELIKEFWTIDSPLQKTIILLVENISQALGSEFKVYLPQLIPQILRVLMHDTSPARDVTGKLLVALEKFGSTTNDYMHLILPPIVKLFDSPEVPLQIRGRALECIDRLSESLDFSEYASRIIHPLVRCLDSTPELRTEAMDTLASLVVQLGRKYTIFTPMVHKVLIKQKITHQRYELLCARVMEGDSPSDLEDSMIRYPGRRRRGGNEGSRGKEQSPAGTAAGTSGTVRKLPVNPEDLKKAWAVSKRVNKEDWLEWYGGLCRELLKASPSPALRACWTVAQW